MSIEINNNDYIWIEESERLVNIKTKDGVEPIFIEPVNFVLEIQDDGNFMALKALQETLEENGARETMDTLSKDNSIEKFVDQDNKLLYYTINGYPLANDENLRDLFDGEFESSCISTKEEYDYNSDALKSGFDSQSDMEKFDLIR